MLSDCPKCGQKLRPQWARCPRCRTLLAELTAAELPAPTNNPTSGASRPAWMLPAAAALVVAVVMVVAFTGDEGSDQASPATVATAAPATPPATATPADAEAPTSLPTVPTTTFEAIDSKRAGAVAYATGDFATALAQMEAAVAVAPADPDARNNLGQLLVRNGRAADALPHFDEAVRLNGNRWDYRFNRARTYGLLDRWREAVAEYQRAAQIFPGDHATLYNLGLALLRVQDYPAAATALEQAVAAAPDEHDFLISLGTAYVGAAQNDRARATFERFLEVAPDDAEAPKVRALLQALAESAP